MLPKLTLKLPVRGLIIFAPYRPSGLAKLHQFNCVFSFRNVTVYGVEVRRHADSETVRFLQFLIKAIGGSVDARRDCLFAHPWNFFKRKRWEQLLAVAC